MLYPIAVVNEDIRDERGDFANRGKRDSRLLLTRRFFLGDKHVNQAGRELFRIPEEVFLNVQAQLGRRGRIYPPYLRIRHTVNVMQGSNER